MRDDGRWEDGKMVSWCVTSKRLLLDRFFFGFDVLTAIRSKVLDLEEIM